MHQARLRVHRNQGGGMPQRRHPRDPVAPSRSRKLWCYLPLWLAVGLSTLFFIAMYKYNGLPQAVWPKDSEEYDTVKKYFVEANARRILEDLTHFGPRPFGSSTHHTALMILTKEVQKIEDDNPQSLYKLEVSYHKSSGNFELFNWDNVYSNVTNLAVRISKKGSKVKNCLLINGHFDTKTETPGAGDNAAMIAVMLEVMRVLYIDTNNEIRHPVVFLFNGAMSTLVQGIHGFMSTHKWANHVRAFINLDSFGNGNKDMIFRTTTNNDWILNHYRQVPYAFGTILIEALIRLQVFNIVTEFSVLADIFHIPGVEIVYYHNGYVWQTPFDKPEILPNGTLQNTGENLLVFVRGLANANEMEGPLVLNHAKSHYYDILGMFLSVVSQNALRTLNTILVLLSLFITMGALVKLSIDTDCCIGPAADVVDRGNSQNWLEAGSSSFNSGESPPSPGENIPLREFASTSDSPSDASPQLSPNDSVSPFLALARRFRPRNTGKANDTRLMVTSIIVLQVAGYCGAFFIPMAISVILDWINHTLSWYRNTWMLLGLYICPSILGYLLPNLVMMESKWMEKWTLEQRVNFIIIEHTGFTAFLCFTNIVWDHNMTYIAMFCMISHAFGLVLSMREKRFIWQTRMLCQVIVFPYICYTTLMVLDVLIPAMGRSGQEINPEYSIACVCAVAVIFSSGYMLPLLYLFRKPKHIVSVLTSISVVFFFLALGFPYAAETHVKRVSMMSIERQINTHNNMTTEVDYGFVLDFKDRRGDTDLKESVARLRGAETADAVPCKTYAKCRLPVFSPNWDMRGPEAKWYRLQDKTTAHGNVRLGPQPGINTSLTYLNKSYNADKNTMRYFFNISGPSQMNVFVHVISNKALIRGWSFVKNNDRRKPSPVGSPVRQAVLLFNDGVENLMFYIDIWRTNLNHAGKNFEITVAGHYVDDKAVTDKLTQYFVSDFPDWSYVRKWPATIITREY